MRVTHLSWITAFTAAAGLVLFISAQPEPLATAAAPSGRPSSGR
jgi:hypothetical protein